MQKNFSTWSLLKEKIEASHVSVYANKREIWWCSLGENVGTEFCGKNNLFERPILVLKVYNKSTLKILPLTSKDKMGKYYVKVTLGTEHSFGSLSQVKTISTKRLSRKIGKIDKIQFQNILQEYKNTF